MQAKVPSSQRVFRIAAWIWLTYLAALVVVDAFIYPLKLFLNPIFDYHLISALPAVLFLALAYTRWLEKHARWIVPGMILLITATPILTNYLLNLHLPPAPLSNLEGMVLRQLPVLLIGLVLIGWHYGLGTMLTYSLVTNLAEFGLVFLFGLMSGERFISFSFIILIRTVSFVVVGVFVNLLIVQLRYQQESLMAANTRLTHYARTLENLTLSRERNRMSRELHDTVVHSLSGLSVQLETARAYWDVDPITARGLVDSSLAVTRSGLEETRRAIKALRASPLDDLGLVRALRTLLEDVGMRGRLSMDTTLPADHAVFPPDVEQCVYRIAQEALENVLHHAQATHLTFRLSSDERLLNLLIRDDGVGFDPRAGLPTGHFGLTGMRERAELAGGQLKIDSCPNAGTAIHLVLRGGAG
jgi:signal transduction histidine kinase